MEVVNRAPRDLGCVYAAALCIFFAYGVASFTIPLRVRDLGASPMWVGLVAGTRLAVAAALALPAGRASDRVGRRPMLLVSVALLAASTGVMALAGSVSALFVVSVIGGIGSAAVLPGLNATIASTVRRDGQATGFAYLTLCIQGGMSIGPAIAGYAIDHLGYGTAFLLSALLNLVALAPIRAGIPVTDGPRAASVDRGAAMAALLRDPAIWTAWLCTCAAAIIWGTNGSLVPAYLRTRDWTPSVIGLLMAVQTAVNAGSRIPLAWAFRRVGARLTVCAWAVAAYAAYFWALPWLTDVWSLGAAMVGASLCVALVYMIVQVSLSLAVTPDRHGLVMGGYATAIYLGLALGPMLCGVAAAVYGYPAGFRFVATLALLPAAVAAWHASRLPARSAAIAPV
ncbi:MAG: MFS transporter [Armatimonadetes bacterium]|nr:MFS transporter [Armatimonadota bacterium]